ncbi:hypothetical protein V7O67_06685 [Methanolobus sp. ZRKC4]|uniref:hypothetical protein n=1 Tax=Methanolobus sp. ZRKC4 TaxID=3125787 RepID=UPI0032499745
MIQICQSEFYIYSFGGRLIKSEYDTNEYTDFARQIDSKRNSIYLEISGNRNSLNDFSRLRELTADGAM